MKNERKELEGYAFKRKEEEPIGKRAIAIEGPVCAGKTTVLEKLKNRGISVVEEYSEYVDSATRDFPKFPPKDEEAAKDSFRFFFELETKRKQDMEASGNHQIALDRSIYTLLAFEVGALSITGINILPWATEYLEEHRDEIIIPEQVVYMDVPAEVSRERADEGNIPIAPFLLTKEFNDGFRDFFLALKDKAPDLIDIVDATKEPEEINLEVSNLVSRQDSI